MAYKEYKITGVVLSGGKSTRMGTDKAMVLYKGKPLLKNAIDIIEPVCDEILVSSSNKEHHKMGYTMVADKYKDIGPIGGIYSALSCSEYQKCIITSCDMPLLPLPLFIHLLEQNGGGQVIIPRWGDGKVEPLAGIYTSSILPIIEKQIDNKDYKLMNLLKAVNASYVDINDTLPFYSDTMFLNCNKLDDLS